MIKSSFKKFKKYRNIRLLFYVLFTSIRISFLKKGQLLKFIDIDIKNKSSQQKELEYLYRYICLCTTFRRLFGIMDTCLTKSLLQCRIYRDYGIDAKINFGLRQATELEPATLNSNITGHCWVTVDNCQVPHNFPFIFQYPKQS